MKQNPIYGLIALLLAVITFGQTRAWPVSQCFSWRVKTPPAQLTFSRARELGPAPSPDGKNLAFEYFYTQKPDLPQIWVMELAHGFKSARPLVADMNYDSWPSWSPDSQWISFMSGKLISGNNVLTDQIYKVKVNDGTIIQLTHFPKETALGDSTSWSPDGRIAFGYDDNIYTVNASGDNPSVLIDLHSVLSPDTLWGIEWSPDGSHLAFRGNPRGSPSEVRRIWVVDSLGQRALSVTQGPRDENPSWVDNEHILFERWNEKGEVRICGVCLSTSQVSCLTRSYVDITPIADANTRMVYFARGMTPRKDIDAWLPETHIYTMRLQ